MLGGSAGLACTCLYNYIQLLGQWGLETRKWLGPSPPHVIVHPTGGQTRLPFMEMASFQKGTPHFPSTDPAFTCIMFAYSHWPKQVTIATPKSEWERTT